MFRNQTEGQNHKYGDFMSTHDIQQNISNPHGAQQSNLSTRATQETNVKPQNCSINHGKSSHAH